MSISRFIVCGEGTRKYNIVGNCKQAAIGFGVWQEMFKGKLVTYKNEDLSQLRNHQKNLFR
eukprot:3820036-Ditylum_brightwellii.AAC.1